MLALIEQITASLHDYAPDHAREARRVLLRIYRDTRFAADKSPYKQHLAAWWGLPGAEKTSGAGFYLHLSADELMVAAGLFMPTKEQLRSVRLALVDQYEQWSALLEVPELCRHFALHDPQALTRMPKGFRDEHPAANWIKARQWGVFASLPVETALKPELASTLDQHFRLASPLVDFLDRAIASGHPRPRSPLTGSRFF